MEANSMTVPKIDFSFIDLPSQDHNRKIKPFVEHVQKTLIEDLQKYDTFGCRISDCHTHAGSKLHFSNFVEAELLFHNSYYNKAFAKLTIEHLKETILSDENNKGKSILLIGYETYSEMYLQELKDLLVDNKYTDKCEYCVFEATSKALPSGAREITTRIRNLGLGNKKTIKIRYGKRGKDNKPFPINNTLCLFIVPINTSLSTMDKMVALFLKTIEDPNDNKGITREHLCLITLGNGGEDNEYFTIIDDKLKPTEGRFEHLKDFMIKNFVLIENAHVHSTVAQDCKECFPEEDNHGLLTEKPLFNVNRGSVVPMLELYAQRPMEPLDDERKKQRIENFKRVVNLSQFLTYKHIVREDNHFQYYIETEKYLQSVQESEELSKFFDNLKKDLERKKQGKEQVFDYLVAPRHETNAIWVHLVNKNVFKEEARIIHLDITKEFRSNIKTKYSDLTASLESISASKEKATVRFHYIDDAIYSGNTFIRAKNLFLSLTKDIKNIEISIFDSIITLISRISDDTKRFYLWGNKYSENEYAANRIIEDCFRSFVEIGLSPMRKYEDACTLCKLRSDYHIIRDQCATNKLADACSTVIINHQIDSIDMLPIESAEEKSENRYIFIVSHLLYERLANKLYFEEDAKPVNAAKDTAQIKEIFDLYYNAFRDQSLNGLKRILKSIKTDKNDTEEENQILGLIGCDGKNECIYKVAFIKAISRPFFTFNIRYRQAAFAMCLKKTDDILSQIELLPFVDCAILNNDINKLENLILISFMLQTLIKALCDMNASYLIRKTVLEKLIEWAKIGDRLSEAYKSLSESIPELKRKYYSKAIFTSESLIHYIKKSIVLSDDETKSLFLEHVLVNGTDLITSPKNAIILGVEQFYEEKLSKSGEELDKVDEYRTEITVTSQGKLYLENNAILKTVLDDPDDGNLNKLIAYLDSYKKERREENTHNKDTKVLYFFEHFIELCKLNGIELLNNTPKKIFETYRELLTRIRNFASGKNGNRKNFSKCISELLSLLTGDSIQALAFVHDEYEENTLFRFFTLVNTAEGEEEKFKRGNWYKDDELLTTHAFFHDDNIEEVDQAIANHEEDDLIFINDNLFFIDKNQKALIVRFRKNKDLYETKNNKIPIKDESIYVQIWNFDRNNIRHWFALKTLLSLRKEFSKLIEDVNLQELIDERKVEMKQVALSINKAATHSNAQKYIIPNIVTSSMLHTSCNDSNDLLVKTLHNELNEDDADNEPSDEINKRLEKLADFKFSSSNEMEMYLKIMEFPNNKFRHKRSLFDRYYQLLSDEVVSSLYRRLIRGERVVGEGSWIVDSMNSIYDHEFYYDENGNEVYKYHIMIPNDVMKKTTNCCITVTSKNKMKFDYYADVGNIPVFMFVILITAMNAVLHAEATYLNVEIDENGMTLRNKCGRFDKKQEKYWHIPPWLFKSKEDHHITIWTFMHIARVKNEGGGIECECKVERGNGGSQEFVTIFRCGEE